MKTQRRVGAATAVLLFGGAGILPVAGAARAAVAVPGAAPYAVAAAMAPAAVPASLSYTVRCVPPVGGGGPVEGTVTVSVTAPAGARAGDEAEVVWKTVRAASDNTGLMDLGKDTVKPTGYVTLGGALGGQVKLEGERKNPPIPKKAPMVLSDMKGKIKLTRAGEVTLTPGRYEVDFSGFVTTCSPRGAVGVAATVKVADAGATASGGTTTGGTTGATASGGATGGSGGRSEFPGKAVEVAYDCGPTVPGGIKTPVTVDAKRNGGGYDLTVRTAKGAMASPMALPAGALKPSMEIRLGGADSGTVKVSGPANTEPVPDKAPVSLSDMTGTYRPGATGKVTLTPDRLTIDVTLAPGSPPIGVPCTARSSGVSLELDTAAQPGGSGSPSTAGAASGGVASAGAVTGGGLAETGARDDGIGALALAAATALLLGAAVFTFTPWRRLRPTRRQR